MRNRALLFGLLISRSLMLGGCSQQPEDAGSCQDSSPAPALTLEELDRAYVRDQGVYAPEFGDGEMGQTAQDAFGLGRAMPDHFDLNNLFNTLPRDTGNFDIVFFYYIKVEVVEFGPPPAAPYTDLWYCEPDPVLPLPTLLGPSL